MLRIAAIFVLLAAVVIGVFSLGDQNASVPGAPQLPAINYGLWVLGLAMGLVAAWLARFDWGAISVGVATWLHMQRRRAGLLALGLVFASVLVFY